MDDNTLLNNETIKIKDEILTNGEVTLPVDELDSDELRKNAGYYEIKNNIIGYIPQRKNFIIDLLVTPGRTFVLGNKPGEQLVPFVEMQRNNAQQLDLSAVQKANRVLTGGLSSDLTGSYYDLPINLSKIERNTASSSEVDLLDTSQMPVKSVMKHVWKEQREVGDLTAALGYQAATGKISDDAMKSIGDEAIINFHKENGTLENYDLLQNPLKVIAGESARQSSVMMDMLKTGLKSGLEAAPIGAGIALVAGQVGPQVLTPEEVFTVPAASVAAFTVGMAYGGASYVYKLETGQMYSDLIKGGVSKNIAQPVAFVTGALNTFIQTAGIAAILSGHPEGYLVAKAAKTIGSNLTKQALTLATKSFMINNGIQVAQGVTQTLVDGFTKYAIQTLMDNPSQLINKKQFMQNLKDSIFMSLAGGVGLAGLGSTLEAARFHRAVNRNFKQIREEQKTKALNSQNVLLQRNDLISKTKKQLEFEKSLKKDMAKEQAESNIKLQQETIKDTKEKVLQNIMSTESFKNLEFARGKNIPVYVRDINDEKTIKYVASNMKGTMASYIGTWSTLTDILNRKLLFSEKNNPLNVVENEQQYKKWIVNSDDIHSEYLRKEFTKIGLGQKELVKKISEDFKTSVEGTYTDKWGRDVSIKWTPQQARSFFMLMQDADTKERLRNGGFTFEGDLDPKQITTEKIVRSSLTLEDMAIIEANKKFFDEDYDRINDIYMERFGKEAPYRENYFSRSMQTDLASDIVDIKKDEINTNLLPSSLQGRAIGLEKESVKILNDMDVIRNNIRQTAQWVAWQDKIELLNEVFKDPEIRQQISKDFGKFFLESIDQHIKSFAVGESRLYKNLSDKWLGKYVVSNFTTAQLAYKSIQYAKQMSSTVQYLPYFSDKSMFITGLINFVSDPKTAIDTLKEIPDIRYRLTAGMTKEVAMINEIQHSLNTKDLRALGMFFTKYGDFAAVATGGWALYLDQMQKHGNSEKAMDYVIKATNEIQQSPDLSQLTALQKQSNPFFQIGGNFMQGPNQILNKMVRDIIQAGRTKSAEDIEKVLWSGLTFGIFAPVIREVISVGSKVSKSDLVSSMLTGMTDGVMFAGDFYNWLVTGLTAAHFDKSNKMYELTTMKGFDYIINTLDKSGRKFFSDVKKGHLTVKSLEGIGDIMALGGDIGTGLPFSRTLQIGKAYAQNKDTKATLMLLGFPPSAASLLAGEKKKNKVERSI